jgi:hypothetical protein
MFQDQGAKAADCAKGCGGISLQLCLEEEKALEVRHLIQQVGCAIGLVAQQVQLLELSTAGLERLHI